jgi:hypothetical protein
MELGLHALAEGEDLELEVAQGGEDRCEVVANDGQTLLRAGNKRISH